jgi:nucleoside-diphosphate-sugar epimerase
MNYLITGGAGFIGSHLIERLLRESDNKVTVLESNSGKTAKVSEDKIIIIDDFSEGKWANLPQDPRLTVYEASIMDPSISKYFRDIDVVFHLAALTRPQWSILYPAEACRTNVEGTINVFNHCKDNKVKRVVFISSSSVYGQQDEGRAAREEDTPNPMCPYALNKFEGELHAKLFEKLHDLQVNSIRPFNVYGSRMNPNGVYAGAVPKFIDLISKGMQPIITGDGEQQRDFIYVDDTVEIMYLASTCDTYGEVFNAGSGDNISINNLFKMICKQMNKEILPMYIPPVFEPSYTLADMNKVKQLLNFVPNIGLDEGLKRTIEATIGVSHG